MKHISNVLLYENGKVLLGKRSPQRQIFPKCWAAFGGHAEAGETPVQTAKRELNEELGVETIDLTLIHSFDTFILNNATKFSIFLCSQWIGKPQLLGIEHSEMRWFDIAEAVNLYNLALSEYKTSFLMASKFALHCKIIKNCPDQRA